MSDEKTADGTHPPAYVEWAPDAKPEPINPDIEPQDETGDRTDAGGYIGWAPDAEPEPINADIERHDERVSPDETRPRRDKNEPEMRDVVEGPIGDASLGNPATIRHGGADVGSLDEVQP